MEGRIAVTAFCDSCPQLAYVTTNQRHCSRSCFCSCFCPCSGPICGGLPLTDLIACEPHRLLAHPKRYPPDKGSTPEEWVHRQGTHRARLHTRFGATFAAAP